jgi:hypothetical protein
VHDGNLNVEKVKTWVKNRENPARYDRPDLRATSRWPSSSFIASSIAAALISMPFLTYFHRTQL